MTLYRQSVRGFSAVEHHLSELLSEQMLVTTGRRPSRSEALSWQRSIPALRADLLVRNVYKVLLTRGLRGVSIYSTDAATRTHLREFARVAMAAGRTGPGGGDGADTLG